MFDSIPMPACPKTALPPVPAGMLRFGLPGVDGWLKGGLRRDGVHEFYAVADADKAAAMALTLLLARGSRDAGAPLMWLRVLDRRSAQRPYALGLTELGVDANGILLMQLPDLKGVLRAAVESVRHGGVCAVLLEIEGRAQLLDLTASRRLALAAEKSGTAVLIVRNGVEPAASAAHSRWQVASAPSAPLAANAPGHPVFDLRLLRQRGGAAGLHVQLEWDREQSVFRTPLHGGPSAVPASGAVDQGRYRAA